MFFVDLNEVKKYDEDDERQGSDFLLFTVFFVSLLGTKKGKAKIN